MVSANERIVILHDVNDMIWKRFIITTLFECGPHFISTATNLYSILTTMRDKEIWHEWKFHYGTTCIQWKRRNSIWPHTKKWNEKRKKILEKKFNIWSSVPMILRKQNAYKMFACSASRLYYPCISFQPYQIKGLRISLNICFCSLSNTWSFPLLSIFRRTL